jgi:hypothetical protein
MMAERTRKRRNVEGWTKKFGDTLGGAFEDPSSYVRQCLGSMGSFHRGSGCANYVEDRPLKFSGIHSVAPYQTAQERLSGRLFFFFFEFACVLTEQIVVNIV